MNFLEIVSIRPFYLELVLALYNRSCYVPVMPHDGRAIANLILDNFDAVRFDISNNKINKLLYYCHGFNLVRLNEELIRNHIEAWTHGPVIRVVYEEFRRFEHKPILSRASFFNFETGVNEIATYEKVSPREMDLTLKVAGHYVKYSASELEERTHRENSPWWQVKRLQPNDRGMRDRIPNELISRDFVENFGNLGKTN